MKKTLIVSVFADCGKTWLTQHQKQYGYMICDKYCARRRIDLKDVVYVDDVLVFLREAERKGIKSYHISSFLDWDYSDDYFSLKDTDLYPSESTDVFFDIHNG